MDNIPPFGERNPEAIILEIGRRVKTLRLVAGWTQEELAERAGVSLSTLKVFERSGKGSLQRVARIAVALNVDGELRGLFAEPRQLESLEAVERMNRKRAPRRKKKDRPGC